MRLLRTALFVSACVVLSGCGGGSGTAGDPTVREASYGPISTRAVGGVAEPVVLSGGLATVTGIYGASFLNVTVNLPPSTPETDQAWDYTVPIAMMNRGRAGYFDLQLNQSFVPFVSSNQSVVSLPSFSTNGQSILSGELAPGGFLQIFSTATDGSARTQLTSTSNSKNNPHQSPANGNIIFESGGDIWSMTSTGGSITNITNSPTLSEGLPKFNAAGTKMFFVLNLLSTMQLIEADLNGTNQVTRLSASSITGYDIHPTEPLIAVCGTDGPSRFISFVNPTISLIDTLVSESTPISFVGLSFSPSGSFLATKRYNGTNDTVSIFSVTDRTRTDVASMSGLSYLGEWAPLPRKKFFINPTGATLHTNAAGFIYGGKSKSFASLLAFDAQTRNTVDIDPHPASLNSSTYTATITAADKLTMLRYANGMIAPRVTIIDPASVATHAQGALVTFDSNTGKVESVLTFTRSRAGTPATTKSANTLKFNHEFLAAYDENGNLIKNAPKDVTQNVDTGAISYR